MVLHRETRRPLYFFYNNFTFGTLTPQSSDLCSVTCTFKYSFCLFWFMSVSKKWKQQSTFWNEEFFMCDLEFAPGYRNVLQLTDNTQVLQQILWDTVWLTVTNPSRMCQKWGEGETLRWIPGIVGLTKTVRDSHTIRLLQPLSGFFPVVYALFL